MELRGAVARRAAGSESHLRRAQGGRLSDGLGSAPVPPPGPDDHERGPEDGPLVVAYADYECPFCARLHAALRERDVRLIFRHFPVRSKHPRAWAAASAAEAAGRQDRFWDMHDALFADTARLEDPHLWARAEALGLDLERFEADRRSDAVRDRVHRDFRSGIRAGVVATPTAFVDGIPRSGDAAVAALP